MARFYLVLYDQLHGKEITGGCDVDIEFHEDDGRIYGSMDLARFYNEDKPLKGHPVQFGAVDGVELYNKPGDRAFSMTLFRNPTAEVECYFGYCKIDTGREYYVILLPKRRV
jgi:hypothetical protein